MTYDLVAPEANGGVALESSDYRRTHFRIYDENGFASTFPTSPPERRRGLRPPMLSRPPRASPR